MNCLHRWERGSLVRTLHHPVVGRINTYRFECAECGAHRLGDERPQQFERQTRETYLHWRAKTSLET